MKSFFCELRYFPYFLCKRSKKKKKKIENFGPIQAPSFPSLMSQCPKMRKSSKVSKISMIYCPIFRASEGSLHLKYRKKKSAHKQAPHPQGVTHSQGNKTGSYGWQLGRTGHGTGDYLPIWKTAFVSLYTAYMSQIVPT